MTWGSTTLRKGTKTPKICRDMLITDSRGEFCFCEVKNGRMVKRQKIEKDEAVEYITNENLVPCATIFNNCWTYRTPESAKLVQRLLGA